MRFLRMQWFLLLLLLATAGSQTGAPPAAAPEVPVAPVSHPVERSVTDNADFTGRTDAVQTVNVGARVTGYLVRMPFEGGAEVKTGELLFQIVPQPYEAQVRLGVAQVA